MFHSVHPRNLSTHLRLLFLSQNQHCFFVSSQRTLPASEVSCALSLRLYPFVAVEQRNEQVHRIALSRAENKSRLHARLPFTFPSTPSFLSAELTLRQSTSTVSFLRSPCLSCCFHPPHLFNLSRLTMFARNALRSTVAPLRFNKINPVPIRTLTTSPTSTSYENILISSPAPGVSLVTLNRPKALNGEYARLAKLYDMTVQADRTILVILS